MKNNPYQLLKGNEAFALAAIRIGCDGYFGYPITPQSEVLETLCQEKPWETTGMVVLQTESELASINMLYAAGATGKHALTSSSSPGVALMQEGITFMAGAEIPGVILNVQRGGPALGTIQPSQSDYFQSTRGGGNGDYEVIVLAPASVQEMADFLPLAFALSFQYRTPAIILSDGIIGQMMEKVKLPDYTPRLTQEEIETRYPWAATGCKGNRQTNIFTTVDLDPARHEQHNLHLQAKYATIQANEQRSEEYLTADANYLVVAFGSTARIAQAAVQQCRTEGLRVGLLRPITLWPFPQVRLAQLAPQMHTILCAENNAGQMIQDVRLATNSHTPIHHLGRMGGMVLTPHDIHQYITHTYPQ